MNEDTLRAFNYGARREASGDSATVRAATLIDHLIMSSFRTRCLNVGHKAAKARSVPVFKAILHCT